MPESVRRTSGVKILVFTTAEIEVLSLLAACRDAPSEILSFTGQETASVLLELGLIRLSRNGVSLRVTSEGHRLLQKAGRDFPSDGQYRCAGQVLERRLITANFLFWLKSCGVRYFPQKPVVTEGLAFLPSFMMRRERGRNVLGASRFIGLLYAEKTVFPCYYATDSNDGLYPAAEQRTFSSEYLTCRKKPTVLFTGREDFEELLMTCRLSKSTASTAEPYFTAAGNFACEVCFIPMNADGFRQLKILSVKNFQRQIFDAILPGDWEPVRGRPSEAVQKSTGENYLISVGGNFAALQKRADEPLHVLLLAEHSKAAGKYLKGTKLILHPVSLRDLEGLLRIVRPFPTPPVPFMTKEGDYLYASVNDFGKGRK